MYATGKRYIIAFVAILISIRNVNVRSFTIYSKSKHYSNLAKDSSDLPTTNEHDTRRTCFTKIVTTTIAGLIGSGLVPVVYADDDTDLTKLMFNPDGSLKQETDTVAKFRDIDILWGISDNPLFAVDGTSESDAASRSSIILQYKLPEKWDTGTRLYVDRSSGGNLKVCNRITVYQAPGLATVERLEKASRNGVYQSLGLTQDFKDLKKADLLSGHTVVKGGQKYFEFDMAVAPSVCDSKSPDNLGLGFCPYETIYLLSATVLNNKLYILIEECEKSQWKRANAELRQVRSSFIVQAVDSASKQSLSNV